MTAAGTSAGAGWFALAAMSQAQLDRLVETASKELAELPLAGWQREARVRLLDRIDAVREMFTPAG